MAPGDYESPHTERPTGTPRRAGAAGTVLAVLLFTTHLVISRRGLQHTPKRGCGTHVSPTVLNCNGQLLALCCARSSSHTSSAVWTPFPEASFRGRRTGPAAMVRPVWPWPYRFLREKNGVAWILT